MLHLVVNNVMQKTMAISCVMSFQDLDLLHHFDNNPKNNLHGSWRIMQKSYE